MSEVTWLPTASLKTPLFISLNHRRFSPELTGQYTVLQILLQQQQQILETVCGAQPK